MQIGCKKEYKCVLKDGHRRKARDQNAKMMNSLNACSIYRPKCVISRLKLTNEPSVNDPYSIFKVEPLHFLHLDISEKSNIIEPHISYRQRKKIYFDSMTANEKSAYLKHYHTAWL